MGDWTPVERPIKTRLGVIHYGGPCRDDYPNMERLDQDPDGANVILTLQRPAMKAFLAAQVRFAKKSGWSEERINRTTVRIGGKRYPVGRRIVILAGTNRTCATQTALYRKDPNRYAAPQITGHTRGLAIDRSNIQLRLADVDQCLKLEGWTRTRPEDEPWHWSYGVTI